MTADRKWRSEWQWCEEVLRFATFSLQCSCIPYQYWSCCSQQIQSDHNLCTKSQLKLLKRTETNHKISDYIKKICRHEKQEIHQVQDKDPTISSSGSEVVSICEQEHEHKMSCEQCWWAEKDH